MDAGKGGEIQKIGEFCMVFSELPNMSEPNTDFGATAIGGNGNAGGNAGTGAAAPAAAATAVGGLAPSALNTAQTAGPRPQGNGMRQNLNGGGGTWPANASASAPSSGPGGGFLRGSAPIAKGAGKRDPRKKWLCIFSTAQERKKIIKK